MNEINNLASLGNILIGLMILIGGYIAIRNSKQQGTSTFQAQAIDALKAELDTLQRRLEVLERENTRLHQTLSLIKDALRKRGLSISIDGDLVTIGDASFSQSARIQEDRA